MGLVTHYHGTRHRMVGNSAGTSDRWQTLSASVAEACASVDVGTVTLPASTRGTSSVWEIVSTSRSNKRTESQLLQTAPVIVLGMHRSGTSLTTRLLKDTGLFMGRRLSTNDEARYFQHLNRSILADAGSRWSDVDAVLQAMDSETFLKEQANAMRRVLFTGEGMVQFFGADLWESICYNEPLRWGWKDPLNTITFPIWLRIFPHARFVHVIRNDVDVAISMHRRTTRVKRQWWRWWWYLLLGYGTSTLDFGHCFHPWEKYVTFVVEHRQMIPDDQYLALRYEELPASPQEQLQQVTSFLGYPVKDSLLHGACEQIDKNRLDNTRYADMYQDEISALDSSDLLRQLGYSHGDLRWQAQADHNEAIP